MALGFFSRLKEGLTRSTQKLTTGITAAFTKRTLDDAALAELEELLIAADLGPAVAEQVITSFRGSRFGTDVTDTEVKQALAADPEMDIDTYLAGKSAVLQQVLEASGEMTQAELDTIRRLNGG